MEDRQSAQNANLKESDVEEPTTKKPKPTLGSTNRSLYVPFAFILPIALISYTQVAAKNQPPPTPNSMQARTSAEGARINPNEATWSDLALLPRIGEITAKRIIAYREEHKTGDSRQVFKNPSDLELVKGIGPITVAKIAPYLRFD